MEVHNRGVANIVPEEEIKASIHEPELAHLRLMQNKKKYQFPLSY